MLDVEVEIGNEKFLAKALERADGGDMLLIFHTIDDIRAFIERTARFFAPKRTGRLAEEGISSRVDYTTENTVRMEVGLERHPSYGILVHEGSGLFGSFHRPIFPKHGNVLAFDIAGRHIFARSVAGQEPQPFIREAVLFVENTYIPAKIELLGQELSRL